MSDDLRARGRWMAVDGLLRVAFGDDAGDAGDRAIARLRAASRPLRPVTAARATSSGRLRARHARARRRTRTQGPLALVAVASAAAVLAAALILGRPHAADAPAPIATQHVVEPPRAVAAPVSGATRIAAGRARRADGGPLDGALPDGVEVSALDETKLALPDGSEATLAPGTRLSCVDGRDGRRLRLAEGAVEVAAQPQSADRPLRVVTDDAEAAVVGTRFVVAREDGATRVSVAHGRVRVTRGGESVEVPAGRALRTLPLVPVFASDVVPNAEEISLLPRGPTTEPADALALSAAAATRCAERAARPGLVVQFFDGPCFEQPRLTRVDATIAFAWRPWGTDRPITEPEARGAFSARWSGLLRAPRAGRYGLATLADDGARVWIDGRLILDDWQIHPQHRAEAGIALDPGLHALVVEYCQLAAHAQIELRWTMPGGDEAVVPASALAHARCEVDR